ncbi:MAG: CinA family protein, partial [Bacteroidetes bacterium]
RVNYFIDQIALRLPVYAFGRNNDELSSVVGELLVEKKATVATVESCTGGKIASEISKVPGASRYFQGAFVTYSNDLKMMLAGVRKETLIEHGAVSQETVTEMALGGRKVLGVDYSIAVSGIAGPEGGSEEKPVGTVWIAVAGPEGVTSKKFQFGTDRNRTIEKTVGTALNMLRCVISKINFEKSS